MNIDQASEHQIKRERQLKVIISAYIIVQFVLTIAWLSPEKFALRRAIVDAASGVYKFAGLWQGWELFAPAIRNINSHTVAILRFEDGSATEWPLPRFEQLSGWEKVRKDKFRKWNGDNVQWERYKEFWPAFARYVAKLHYDGTGPKPVSLTLMLFSSTVPDISTNTHRDRLPKHDKAQTTFFYTYKPEDLSI
jgi:hypothetical protein